MSIRAGEKIAVLLVGIAAVVALFFVLGGWQTGEPGYQGKKLSEWLKAFSPINRNRPGFSQRDSSRAVRAAGTNAFPLLFEMLRATDSPIRTKLNGLLKKQHWVDFRFRTAQDLQNEAEEAFQILGRKRSEAAVPELLKLYGQQTTDDGRALVASVLGQVGPGAKTAVPILTQATTSTNSHLSGSASTALQQINLLVNNGVTGMIRDESLSHMYNGLLDTDPRKQEIAARDSVIQDRRFRRSVLDADLASAKMSAVIELARETNGQNYWAKFLLEELDPELAARVLTNGTAVEKRVAAASHPPESTRASATEGQSARLLAVGDWSKAVDSEHSRRLRGRLLVYEAPHFNNRNGEWWGNAMVSVELQDVIDAWDLPMTVCFDVKRGLEFELRDAQGKEVPAAAATPVGRVPEPFWASVPFDGSMRLRADRITAATPAKPDGLTLALAKQSWHIAAGDTNSYFLSARFAPPGDVPDLLDYDAWTGTLELPAVEIRAPKQ